MEEPQSLGPQVGESTRTPQGQQVGSQEAGQPPTQSSLFLVLLVPRMDRQRGIKGAFPGTGEETRGMEKDRGGDRWMERK